MRCGCYGGGFVVLNAQRIGCANARNKGTCDNRHTIRRDALEATVLEACRAASWTRRCAMNSAKSTRAT
jgi:site-specific DNA recombinase